MDDGVTIELREGFEGDRVVIRTAIHPPIMLASVRTRMQLGLAGTVPLGAVEGHVQVQLPARGLDMRIDLHGERPLWVGVSLSRDGTRLEVEQQTEPFRFA